MRERVAGVRARIEAAHARPSVSWRVAWRRIWLSWTATRALLTGVVLWQSTNYLPDVYLYATWATMLVTGQYPVGDPYWQYPPGAGVLFALSAVTPPDPVIGFVILALAADAAILALLLWWSHRLPDASPERWWGPWAWVVGGVAVGPIMLARFDLFPTVFAVAAILLVARPALSGVAAAIGGLLKAWPLMMLVAVPRRRLPWALAGAAITAGVGLAVLSAWAPGSASFLGEQRDRGLQVEGSGALPYLLGGMLGIDPDIVLRYGAFEIGAPASVPIGTVITVAGFAVIAGIGVLRLLGRLETVAPGDVALAALLVSVATSRVFSPQYSVWLVGVAVAAAVDPRSRLRRVAVLLMAMSVVTQAVFPWLYGSLLETSWYAVAPHALRMLMLWAATAAALAVVVAPDRCDHLPVIRRLARSR